MQPAMELREAHGDRDSLSSNALCRLGSAARRLRGDDGNAPDPFVSRCFRDGQQLEAAATTLTVEAPVADVVVPMADVIVPEAVVETPAAIVEEPTIAETAEVVEEADDEPPVEGTRKF